VMEHKSGNISETRKDRGKVTMESLQEVTNAPSNGTIPDLLRPPLPQHWGSQPHHKSAIAIISRTAEATDCKFGRYILRVHANKSPLKIWEKRERGRIQGLPKYIEYPLLSQERVKLRTSNLAGTFTGRVHANKSPLKNFGEKRSVGVSRDCRIFFQYPLLSQERLKLRTSNFVRAHF